MSLRQGLVLAALSVAPLAAQTSGAMGVVNGVVSDASGAKIFGARIYFEREGAQYNFSTDHDGHFFASLPPGRYSMTIVSPGFETVMREGLLVEQKTQKNMLFTLRVAGENEVVTVAADEGGNTSAGANSSALVFKQDQLATLSDNDATLQQQVQALAGGGDGANPPQLFVDGFSGGRFPPKSSIREIRINQNPYSSQYEGLGFGRIEIFTKPGSEKLHGYGQVQGNNRSLNARNPYTQSQPDYHTLYFDGNISGPIGNKTSFFLSGNYNDQQNNCSH